MPSEEQDPSRPGSTLLTVPASFCIHCLNSKSRKPLAGARQRGGRDACCARVWLDRNQGGKVPPGSVRTDEVNGDLRGLVEEKCSQVLTVARPLISGASNLMG